MTPRGPKSRMNPPLTSQGCSSQYTFASRTRRAISCEYCAPKSRMRIFWCAGRERGVAVSRSVRCARAVATLIRLIVGRFLDDLHVVDVRLAHPGRGDLDELRPLAHRLDAVAAHVAHARAQAAHQLVDDFGDRAFVGDA